MINSNFDPYEELILARHNITELVKGLNHCSELLKELGYQHNLLVNANTDLTKRLRVLELELQRLKLAQI